jgi:hypothetical protein
MDTRPTRTGNEYVYAPTASDGTLISAPLVCLRCGCMVHNTVRHDEVCHD